MCAQPWRIAVEVFEGCSGTRGSKRHPLTRSQNLGWQPHHNSSSSLAPQTHAHRVTHLERTSRRVCGLSAECVAAAQGRLRSTSQFQSPRMAPGIGRTRAYGLPKCGSIAGTTRICTVRAQPVRPGASGCGRVLRSAIPHGSSHYSGCRLRPPPGAQAAHLTHRGGVCA